MAIIVYKMECERKEYRAKKTRKCGKPGTTGNYEANIAYILENSK